MGIFQPITIRALLRSQSIIMLLPIISVAGPGYERESWQVKEKS